ncbi:hypothetical protein Tco_0285589 [Tanacetum coccineum]
MDALDASSVIIESNGTESQKQDTSSRSGNDADIRPIYDEEPKAEVRMTIDDNVSATGQQHTEQPKSNNEGECQKDFAKLEAHCINLELQMENNVLKSGQQSQFLKEKSNEAKVNNDIDEIETIKIELEHNVAKLLQEYELLLGKEHLKQTYKDLFDSIKTTRVHRSFLIKGRTQSLVAEKTDISENRALRNFDMMINKMTFEYSSSSLGHQCQMMSDHNSSDLAPQRQMASAENNTSGPVPQCSNDVCSHQFRPRSSSNNVPSGHQHLQPPARTSGRHQEIVVDSVSAALEAQAATIGK